MRKQDKRGDELTRGLGEAQKRLMEAADDPSKKHMADHLGSGTLCQETKSFRNRIEDLKIGEIENEINELLLHNRGSNHCLLTDQELDSLRVGICILDSDCRVVWLSKAMEEFFSVKREEIIGKDKRELMGQGHTGLFEESQELKAKLLECYRNNTYVEHFECHFPAKGERDERWLEHWSQPIESGLYDGGRIEHYYDITEHKITEKVLRSTGYFLRTVISSVNEGLIVYDKELRYQLWNEFMEGLTGIPARQVLGKSAMDFLPHEEGEEVLAMLQRALEGETVRSGEILYWVPTTGKKGWVKAIYSPRIEGNGGIVGAVATYHDISERKRAKQRLRESEIKYRSIYNAAQDAIIITDYATDNIIDVNESACRLYGYSFEEMLKLKSFDTSAEPEKTIQAMRSRVSKIPLRYHRKKDGTVFPVEISASYYVQNRRQLVTAIVRDVTERKRAEEALELSENNLRFLTTKLLTLQENEQRRVSKELHDELGQSLLALKLQARSIEQKIDKSQQNLRDNCLDMLNYIDEVVENVQRLSRDLSPMILENLGLSSALRWLMEDFSRRTGMKSSLEMEDIEGMFSPSSQILIYRVIQECLANIAKHALASQLSLGVCRESEFVTFKVVDNGRGFEPAKILAADSTDKGLGLAAMDERVRMLGGALSIDSAENTGTSITFRVPTKSC